MEIIKQEIDNTSNKKNGVIEIKDSTSGLISKILGKIPGTKQHAINKVDSFFTKNDFNRSDLTTAEDGLLKESIDEKYVPSITEGRISRYCGALIGTIAPYEFLLLGIVLLSGSANSTTGAWYSITLKEMKEKFEGMGLTLTSKLLSSDVSANALSTYAGIGFAYKSLIYNNLIGFIENPTNVNFAKLSSGILITSIIHLKLEKILSNKEQSSMQFDFNDATLAGMTEEQQKFFSKSINKVNEQLERLKNSDNSVEVTRSILGILKSLINAIKIFDINLVFGEKFTKLDTKITDQENNYEGNIDDFIPIIQEVLNELKVICNFNPQIGDIINGKIDTIENLTSDKKGNINNILTSIIFDLIPSIMSNVEEEGEKIINSN